MSNSGRAQAREIAEPLPWLVAELDADTLSPQEYALRNEVCVCVCVCVCARARARENLAGVCALRVRRWHFHHP